MLAYLSIPILGVIYRLTFGPFKKLSLFHAFLCGYVLSIMVALPVLDNGSSYFDRYYYSAIATPFLIWIGGLAAKPIRIRAYDTANYLVAEEFLLRGRVKLIISLSLFVAFYMLDVGLRNSAVVFALMNPGESVAAMELRLQAMQSNIAPFLTKLYGYTRSIFFPFLGAFFTVAYVRRRITRLGYAIVVLILTFYCAYSAAKAPVFYFLLALGLSYYWTLSSPAAGSQQRFPVIRLVILAVLGLVLSALFYPLLHGVGGGAAVEYALEMLWERIFEVPGLAALAYFEVFGNALPHVGLNGSTIGAFLAGEERVSSAQLLYGYFYSNQFSEKGLINGAFFAGMFGDFGVYLMTVGVVLTGFLIGMVEQYLKCVPTEGLRIACRTICSLAVMQLVLADLSSTLFGRGLILMPMLIFALAGASRTLRAAGAIRTGSS